MAECKVIDIFSRSDRALQYRAKTINETIHLALHSDLSDVQEAGRLGRIENLLSSAVPIH